MADAGESPGPTETAPRETASRGWVFIAGSKMWFVLTSTAINLLLPRVFASAAVYGLFATAFGLLSILNNVLVAATLQTTSKMTSEDEARAEATLRRGLLLQGTFGAVLATLVFVGAEPFARDLLLDPALTPLFRIGATVVMAYTLYATLIGSLNGRHRFRGQAGLDAGFSLLRTIGILGGAGLGLGAVPAMGGFALAATGILVAAFVLVGPGRSGQGAPAVRRWVGFAAPIWGYQAFLNAVLLGDVGVLKRTLTELAREGGLGAAAAAELASRELGYYSAAQKFALVPFQLMLSVTFVVFPAVSRAASLGDGEEVRRVIRGALRFALLLLLAFASPIAGAADGVMQLIFPPEYLAGSGALSVLVFGMVALGLFVVCATILSGAGRPGLAAGIAAVALLVVVVGNRGLVLATGLGPETLRAGAIGTTVGMTVAFGLAAGVVVRSFGALFPPATLARAPLAALAGYGVARFVPHDSPLGALAALAAGFAGVLGVLAAVGELRVEEIRRLLRRG